MVHIGSRYKGKTLFHDTTKGIYEEVMPCNNADTTLIQQALLFKEQTCPKNSFKSLLKFF